MNLTIGVFVKILNTIVFSLRILKNVLVATLFTLLSFAHAAAPNSGITYTGRILDSNNQPINSGNVTFNIWIQTPAYCSLYSEQHVVDMAGSSGTYTLEIGKGSLQSFPHMTYPLRMSQGLYENHRII